MKPQDYRKNPLLRLSYSLIAPLYDAIIERASLNMRASSLAPLHTETPGKVLISGIGTGLDLALLPESHRYTALDFNSAMLTRAKQRNTPLAIDWVLGDSMALPFPDGHFDHVVLHLITAVVPLPERCLNEASRVLKPGGTVLLLDKFLRPAQKAPLRRALTPLIARLATRMDVVFEEVLKNAPGLEVISDTPMLAGGWFRAIQLKKA